MALTVEPVLTGLRVLRWFIPAAAIMVAGLLGPASAQEAAPAAYLAPLPSPSPQPHPLDPALAVANQSLQHIQANIRDYTAILSKRLRVDGALGENQDALVKIRNRRVENGRLAIPFSVYVKFLRPDAVKGREVIWVEGRNDGKMVAHEAGLKNLFRAYLDPNGSIAMRGQHYPITEIGLENLVKKVIEKGELDRQRGECQVLFYPQATVNRRPCRMFEIIHPVPRPYFEFHRVQVFFDDELNTIVRYASWTWPRVPGGEPILQEEYTYSDIKVNVGLTEKDFDPDNDEYNFW
ncbi:MAG: DUF1571 domain-containing protein [Thermoguttaceae bacterium]|nr:DUF1571 domain-containing protein [Thermoguttaceae bacterium]